MTQTDQQPAPQHHNRRLARMLLSIDRPEDKSERSLRRLDAIRRSQKRLVMMFLLILAIAIYGFFQELFY